MSVLAAASLAVGCGAKAKAATDPGIPPLAIPAPPQHTVPEVEQAPLRASSAAPDGALTAEAPALLKPPPTRRPAEAEPRPEPAANAAAPAAAAAGPTEPARELRSGAMLDERAVQGRIEGMLKNASDTLNLIDPNRLTPNGKQTFKEARGFITEASRWLKERRFDLAQVNAEKAEKAALSLRR